MKRIKAACICQTLHFTPKENTPPERVSELVRKEIEFYKARLERTCTKYRIVEQTEQNDGSVIVKVIKQSNMSPVGNYLD